MVQARAPGPSRTGRTVGSAASRRSASHEPAAGAVDRDGLEGVRRARRGEATGRGAALEGPLIAHAPSAIRKPATRPGRTWAADADVERQFAVGSFGGGRLGAEQVQPGRQRAHDEQRRAAAGAAGCASTAGPMARPIANATRGGDSCGIDDVRAPQDSGPDSPALDAQARRTNGAPGRARSSRQAVPALVTTGLQHGPPGAGAHPAPEAVLLRPATVVRLEGALHAALLALRLAAKLLVQDGSAADRRQPPARAAIAPGYGGPGALPNQRIARRRRRPARGGLVACQPRWALSTSVYPHLVDNTVDTGSAAEGGAGGASTSRCGRRWR